MPLTFTKYFHMNPKENSGISPIAHSPAKPGNCCFSKIGKMFRAGWLRTASSAPVHLWPLCLWATVFQRRQPYRSMGSPFNLNIGFFCAAVSARKRKNNFGRWFLLFLFFFWKGQVCQLCCSSLFGFQMILQTFFHWNSLMGHISGHLASDPPSVLNNWGWRWLAAGELMIPRGLSHRGVPEDSDLKKSQNVYVIYAIRPY